MEIFFFSPLPSTRLLDHCILLNRLPGGQEAGNFHAAVSTEPHFQNMTHFHSNPPFLSSPKTHIKRPIIATELNAADEKQRSNVRFQNTKLFW